ncbi:MAG: tRNA 2-thiouridine(34) synthase MnmA [Candidatus Adiutrix sp.]
MQNNLQQLLPPPPPNLSPRATALVGLSGGVDSAMTAFILKSWGFQVIAVRMKVYDGPDTPEGPISGCYGHSAQADTQGAKNLAQQLGIDFHEINCASPYKNLVLDYFRQDYLAGRTPNPCIRCNEKLKFGFLPKLAAEQGLKFDFLATGHYARTRFLPQYERYGLFAGLDGAKDQSYFLYRLNPSQLAQVIFPLGELSKTQVRHLATLAAIPMHNKPDSQDFYGGNYIDLLSATPKKGAIVDSQGRVLGHHQGFWNFTPGQRKGLGVAAGEPLYVLRVDSNKNEVVVGPANENSYDSCLITDLNLIVPELLTAKGLKAKMRSTQSLRPVAITNQGESTLEIHFETPITGLAPGQSLVIYHGDMVVGGGIIKI